MKEITMPKLSDTMTEGAVVAWRKSVGDRVERGEIIAEVETDKATMELEAFASGVLLEIRVETGETVPVGTVIGLIGKEGEQPEVRKAAPVEPAPDAELETRDDTGAESEVEADSEDEVEAETKSDSMDEVEAESKDEPEPADSAADSDISAAPVVRRRARELGIDLADVTGSGPDGRILLEDLKPTVAGESQTTRLEGTSRTEESPKSKSSRLPSQKAQDTSPTAAQPLSRMRAAIARTVSDSWRTIPHFSVTVEVRMDAAEQLRQQLKADGTAVSVTALLIKATALALGKFPRLNASLQDGGVVVHPDINIGIVTRRDDGLLVPILRGCGELSVGDIANRTAQLVDRARHGQLSDTELTGGTFAISNLGMFGIHSFVALILPPMAAVLAAGAVREGVVALSGRPEVARLLSLTLSADHRLVDGVYAAEFLQAVRHILETPNELSG